MATRCISGVNETRKPMKKMCPKKVINEIDDSSEDLIDIDEENCKSLVLHLKKL